MQQPPSYQPPDQPPYQQPGFVPPPPKRNLWSWYRARKPLAQIGIGCLTLAIIFSAGAFCITGIAVATSTSAQSTPTPINHVAASATPTAIPKPTPIPQIYPPKTQADLTALASRGNADAIHTFDSESVGLTGACPQPKREVTVDPSITGQQLAEDLLAYFYENQLTSPCGSVVFAYHTQAEANGDGYTAGRINFDVTDSSGQENVDPNATSLTYTLTLDIGGLLTSEQEFVVSY